jgi:hypothetical protein
MWIAMFHVWILQSANAVDNLQAKKKRRAEARRFPVRDREGRIRTSR